MTFKAPHVTAEHEIQNYRGTAPGLAHPMSALLDHYERAYARELALEGKAKKSDDSDDCDDAGGDEDGFPCTRCRGRGSDGCGVACDRCLGTGRVGKGIKHAAANKTMQSEFRDLDYWPPDQWSFHDR
jgi:hypothetical protein